jgi:hypothetical protein
LLKILSLRMCYGDEIQEDDMGLTDKIVSGCKAFEIYLGGGQFEYQRKHRLSWLRFLLVFLSLFRRMP